MSLIDPVLQSLSPGVISRISAGLGIPEQTAELGVRAAAPAILSALVAAGRSENGRVAVTTALSQGAERTDVEFATMSEPGLREAADGGRHLLSSLIGDGQVGMLAAKLQDFAGLPEGTSGAFLGAVSAVLMQQLGVVAMDQGLDGPAVLAALGRDSPALARALPADFASMLEEAGPSEAIPGAPQDDGAAGAWPERGAQTDDAVDTPDGQPASERAPQVGRPWWVWAAGAAALVPMVWLGVILARGLPEAPAAASSNAAAAEIGATATNLLGRLNGTLAGLTDVASAQKAEPDLAALRDEIARLQMSLPSLPAAGRAAARNAANAALPTVISHADRLLGNAEIAAVSGPTIAEIATRLSAFVYE